MKILKYFPPVALWISVTIWLFANTAAAATLTLAPTAISNTACGTLTLQIGGLTNGETVIIDHFVDLNTNGIIDTNDWLMGHYVLTDGQQSIIGGITNLNVPGDLTPTNGAITANLELFAPHPQWPVGSHLLRLTSPSGRFAAITNTFAITNWPYTQSVTGVVKCGSTNVPYAYVALLPSGEFGNATVANASGQYSFSALPGTYRLLAVKNGYVLPQISNISLATNSILTTNLILTGTSTTLGGRFADAAHTNLGLPGIFIVLQSQGGYSAIGNTDTNGSFTIPVIPDIWKFSIEDNSGLAYLGYPHYSGENNPAYDTTTGSVNSVLLTFPKGTGLFYGNIKNSSNVPLPGVQFGASDQYSNLLGSSGWSNPNGNYCSIATTNDWANYVDDGSPIFQSYVVSSGGNSFFSAHQAVQVNFLAVPPTGVITGNVSSVSGVPVAHLTISGNTSYEGDNFQSEAVTDGNGNYSFADFNSGWDVSPNCNANATDGLPYLGYNCTSDQFTDITSSLTVINFTVYPLGTAVLGAPGWIDQGQFGFTLNGADGDTYYVQVSTNLTDWSTITNFTLSGNSIYIEDDSATNSSRFYRAIKQ